MAGYMGYMGGSGGDAGASSSSGSWGGGDGWAMAASAILGGIGSSSKDKKDRKSAAEEMKLRRELMAMQMQSDRELTRMRGDEDRRTIDFQSRLGESNRLNERARLGRAWDSWSSGSGKKPAAQPVATPDYNSYYVPPEQAQPQLPVDPQAPQPRLFAPRG